MTVLMNLALLLVAAVLAGAGWHAGATLVQTSVNYLNFLIERRQRRLLVAKEEAERRRLIEQQNRDDDASIARTGAPAGAVPRHVGAATFPEKPRQVFLQPKDTHEN